MEYKEYTEDEILDCVTRWENSGLLYGIPSYEKQELAPIYDNAARLSIAKFESGQVNREISDLLDSVIYPICRRLYRRVGAEFDIEKMFEELIKRVIENKNVLLQKNVIGEDLKPVNPIVEFCVVFADGYEDETINKKQFTKEEYVERIDKVLDTLRHILLNQEMVSFVDRTQDDWKVMLSDAKKSTKQMRIHNQHVGQDFLKYILQDTNKGI